jgi:predicted O-linked N-acetylglucosamine transferase (SPINDLY family)
MPSGGVLSTSIEELLQKAHIAYAAGDWDFAGKLCAQALHAQAHCVPALNLLGIIKAQAGHPEEAAVLLERVVTAMPENPVAHNNYGNVLRDLGRHQQAAERYDRAIKLDPGYAEAYNNRGAALAALRRPHDALDSYDSAVRLRADYAEAHYNRGVTLHELMRVDEALECYARALAIQPSFAMALYNQGNALQDLRHQEASMRSYRAAIQANDSLAEAHNNLGAVLRDLGDTDQALACFARALQINPALVEAYLNRGHTFAVLMRPEEALANYGMALKFMPERPWLYGAWLYAKMQLCDWPDMQSLIGELILRVNARQQAAQPLIVLAVSDDLQLHRRVAEIAAGAYDSGNPPLPQLSPRRRREIIRVGYYSADFHGHATAILAAGLFELHDRRQFEIIALSFGPNRNDSMRRRLLKAFDRFIDVSQRSDRKVAQLSRELEIDIAVDLKGYTRDARPRIFMQRAAPIQVNYLGFPGTMAAESIDYIVADATVIPEASRDHYSEKVVYLPHSYQVNDRNRDPPGPELSRIQLGLPPEAFVFCCFNSPYKITPATFDVWMRILRQLPTSLLWLYADNQTAAGNLRREASRRGIDATRLRFAMPASQTEHLARQPAADLFLDTFPCGAHTTASDALWMGLPVLTRQGQSFQSKVAASLLRAVGLHELVTATDDQYEAMAISLATDPRRMAEIRARLHANRLTTPLFNTELYTRHLEQAYRQMAERHYAGLAPADIQIAAGSTG